MLDAPKASGDGRRRGNRVRLPIRWQPLADLGVNLQPAAPQSFDVTLIEMAANGSRRCLQYPLRCDHRTILLRFGVR